MQPLLGFFPVIVLGSIMLAFAYYSTRLFGRLDFPVTALFCVGLAMLHASFGGAYVPADQMPLSTAFTCAEAFAMIFLTAMRRASLESRDKPDA